jgi:DNA modification methylase
MNGDSTKEDDVAALMDGKLAHMLHTDPPYNINYPEFNMSRNDASKDWASLYCSDWKDKMTDEEYAMFLVDFLKLAKQFMIPTAHYYIWHATSYYAEVLNALVVNEIPYDKVPIQWVKQVAPLSHVRYKRKSEPCVYGGKGAVNGMGEGARWFGPNNEVNIWDINRDHNVYYIHPTQKPIALAARAIKNSSKIKENVLDMFGGSGSTMMAADQLKRNAYLMELGPEFCDLIVGRFAKYKLDFNQEFKILRNGEDYTLQAIDLIEKLEIRTAEKILSTPETE